MTPPPIFEYDTLVSNFSLIFQPQHYLGLAALHVNLACSRVLTSVAFYFAFFPTDFRAKDRLTARSLSYCRSYLVFDVLTLIFNFLFCDYFPVVLTAVLRIVSKFSCPSVKGVYLQAIKDNIHRS